MSDLQNRSPLDWDDLRLFLALARSRSMALAARQLGVDPTTLGRRMTRLARAVGAPLFETVGGRRQLTERGLALFGHAETIESEALALCGGDGGRHAQELTGQVRLSVAEGLATWVLAPALTRFALRHPGINVDLVTGSGMLNPSKREADISVMLARPRSGRLMSQRLTNYTLGLYAARDYLAQHLAPRSIDELFAHRLVGYVPDFIYAPELDYLSEIAPGLEASLRSTSINVKHRLIAEGAGLGVLPAFIAARDPRLVPVMAETIRLTRSFWLVTHADFRRLARIDAVADWLRETLADMP